MTLLGLFPLYMLIQTLHWFGFFLDELLFRNYREIAIRKPVFVLGPPRSGTTLVHRVLARDDQFTTLRTWECLFAPSISQRRFWMALGRLDRRLGGYLCRGMQILERRLSNKLDAIHKTRLDAPEEDYLTLMPILACFFLVLPFPCSDRLWRLGTFDRDIPDATRLRILSFYRANLQRHLYVHGPEKRLLSKNASFGGWAGSLRDTFPDACFLCCMRDPLETVPSQLSSVAGAVHLFDSNRGGNAQLVEHFIQVLAFQYRNLLQVLTPMGPQQRIFLPMDRLSSDLETCIFEAYRMLRLTCSESFQKRLHQVADENRQYRSRHCYELSNTGQDAESLRRNFADYYQWLEVRTMPAGGSGISLPLATTPAQRRLPTLTSEHR
jgi:hypothetical protein